MANWFDMFVPEKPTKEQWWTKLIITWMRVTDAAEYLSDVDNGNEWITDDYFHEYHQVITGKLIKEIGIEGLKWLLENRGHEKSSPISDKHLFSLMPTVKDFIQKDLATFLSWVDEDGNEQISKEFREKLLEIIPEDEKRKYF